MYREKEWIRAIKTAMMGKYYDDPSDMGALLRMGVEFVPYVNIIPAIADLLYDFDYWEEGVQENGLLGQIGVTVLDGLGLLPMSRICQNFQVS